MVRQNKIRCVAVGAFCVLLFFLSWSTTALGVTQYDCENNVHAYEATIKKEAQETENGLRIYTCLLCGDSYEEEILMYGHVYGEWIVEEEPTCQTPGVRYRVCIQHEHETEVRDTEEIPVADHQYEAARRDATCTKTGLITYRCVWCDDMYTEEMKPLGHAYGEWIVEQQATSSEEGYRYRVCANDPSHIEEEIIPKLSTGVNTADVLLTGANVSVAWVFGISLTRDISVIMWHNRKLKAFIQLRNRSGGKRL